MIQIVATILATLAAVASLTVGLIAWHGERLALYRRNFVSIAMLIGLWVLSNIVFTVTTGTIQYAIALASYSLALLLVVELLRFSLQFTAKGRVTKHMLWITLPGVVGAALAAVPKVIAINISHGAIETRAVPLVLYGVLLLAYIIASGAVLLRGRQRAGQAARQQINLILMGMAISATIGAVCNLLLPLAGVYWFVQLGPAGAVVFIGAVAYAIIRHGLFSVRFAVIRTVMYSLVLATIVVLYFSIAAGAGFLMQGGELDALQLAINTGAALVIALLFQPIRHFFDRLTNKFFYRNSYSSGSFFDTLSQTLTSTTDLRDLLERASDHIAQTLKSDQVFFYVRHKPASYMFAGTKSHRKMSVEAMRLLDTYVDATNETLIAYDSVTDAEVRKVLKRSRISIVLPLHHVNEPVGYLLIGDHRTNGYSSRDIHILKSVPNELVIAIQNALSLQEVSQLNATLQQRIDEATKELRASNEKLQRLDTAKDEFVSMASHQLRTPLTSVKGYISMVLEGDAGAISAMQTKLLGEAFTSSERMVHLINDFLNVSRLQTGKFMIDRRATDLAKVVGQEVDSLQTTARAHDLKLQFRQPTSFPILYIDEGKLRQVIMNFIDNAVYYSREFSTITVKLTTAGGDAILTVKDTGMGVPVSEQVHLFTKFFRATNARRQRPDGTGVGLFLAKKVIVAHGGTMVFESTEGKGSTFGFRLPIKKLSLAPVDESDDLDN